MTSYVFLRTVLKTMIIGQAGILAITLIMTLLNGMGVL